MYHVGTLATYHYTCTMAWIQPIRFHSSKTREVALEPEARLTQSLFKIRIPHAIVVDILGLNMSELAVANCRGVLPALNAAWLGHTGASIGRQQSTDLVLHTALHICTGQAESISTCHLFACAHVYLFQFA